MLKVVAICGILSYIWNMAKSLIPIERIQNSILFVRGQKVMIDRDIEELYGVETRRLNEQVKRNK